MSFEATQYSSLWARIWDRIQKDSSTECWIMEGSTNNAGYVYVTYERQGMGCHVFSYRATHGMEEIPEGFEISHTCGVKRCYNWRHLQCLTISNHRTFDHAMKPKVACHRGHIYTPETSYRDRWGRKCKICRKENNLKYAARRLSNV